VEGVCAAIGDAPIHQMRACSELLDDIVAAGGELATLCAMIAATPRRS
jgi:hypothetical protein